MADLFGLASQSLPPATQKLYASNTFKTRNSSYMSQHIKTKQNLEIPTEKKAGLDYLTKSHATGFARSGLQAGGKDYIRCPLSGTWYLDKPDDRREYHHTGSQLTMKFSHSRTDKPDKAPETWWPAPCAGTPGGCHFRMRTTDAPRSMVFANKPGVSGILAHPIQRSSSSPSLSGSSSFIGERRVRT